MDREIKIVECNYNNFQMLHFFSALKIFLSLCYSFSRMVRRNSAFVEFVSRTVFFLFQNLLVVAAQVNSHFKNATSNLLITVCPKIVRITIRCLNIISYSSILKLWNYKLKDLHLLREVSPYFLIANLLEFLKQLFEHKLKADQSVSV